MYWYFTDVNGKIRTNEWIDGVYYLNQYGQMVTDSYIIDGKLYVFDENGRKIDVVENGWKLVDGEWYYAENGKPYNGWLNHTYYLEDGKMLTDRFVLAVLPR